MNRFKETMLKLKNFFILNKTPVIVISISILVVITAGIAFSKIYDSLKKEELETFVSENPKSVEDFTSVEKEILNVPETKTEAEKVIEDNYTDAYKEYSKLTEEEKKEVEVIPRKEEVPLSELEDIEKDIPEEEVIPEKYDLRDHINIKVEDQAPYGLCWAFASLTSLETHISLNYNIDYDFSELHLDYYMSNLMYGPDSRNVHTGGNFSIFSDYTLLTGPILEEKIPYSYETSAIIGEKEITIIKSYDYTEEEYSKYTSMNPVLHVTDTVDFPSIRKNNGELISNGVSNTITEGELADFRKTVKKHIMKNGSIYTDILGPTNAINSYCDNSCIANHAVSIIGWDDNYSKSNFKGKNGKEPIHDGAYIALNSWGEEDQFTDDGFFYISYDDATVEANMSGITSISMSDAIKISNIENPLIKEIIYDLLKYYIIDYNGEEFITNTALKKVDTLDLKNKNLTSDDLNGLELFKNVNTIYLSGNNITDVSIFKKFKRLWYLDLSDNNITDVSALSDLSGTIILSGNKNVKGYEYLKKISALDLSNTNLVHLNDINDLYSLDLSDNDLDYSNLSIPATVRILKLDNTNFSGEGLSNLNLNELSLKNNKITDISIINNIKASMIDLSNNEITDLSNFNNKNVFHIVLSYNNITGGFSSLKDLVSIYLDHCGLSDLSILSDLENISYLVLDDNNITSVNGITNLNKLTSLSLKNNKISDISNLSNANLYNLNLDNNKIKDVTPINNLQKLSSLSLSGNKKLTGKLTGNISNLNIDGCNLDNSFDLTGLHRLAYVNMSGNNYTISDITDIFNRDKGTDSSLGNYLTVKVNNIVISEDQFLQIRNEYKGTNLKIEGIQVNIPINLDQNNNIILENLYYVRSELMYGIYYDDIYLENGTFDVSAEKIHVNNPSIKNVKLTGSISDSKVFQLTTYNFTF